jgi:hypothetical protein
MDELIKNLNKRDIVISVIVLGIVGLVLYYFFNRPQTSTLELPETPSAIEEELEETFNVTIPENVEKIELRDVSGGTAKGLATRDYSNGQFTLTVLADLPEPKDGFYQGWLVKDETTFISANKLTIAKGGYLLDFMSRTDYSDYPKVLITLEKVFDNQPEVHILEGSF